MRTIFAVCGLLLAALYHHPAAAGEPTVEYVNDYFCRDLITYEAMDEYLDLNRWSFTETASLDPDSVDGTSAGSFILKFNAITSGGLTPCPHIKGYVLAKKVGVYQPPWMEEGFPAILVEIRIPSVFYPEDPTKWPILYGLKVNQRFYCESEVESDPTNPEAAAALGREYLDCGMRIL